MSSNDPRDRAIEAALRKGVTAQIASGECLDAETLAAMADGGLGEHARARAEAHMASCARCQTVMAALVGSAAELEPAPGTSVDRAWWRINLRWMAPLAGVATAVLLWMVVPDTTRDAAQFVDDGVARPSVEPASPPISAPSATSSEPGTSADQKASEEKQVVAGAEPTGSSPARLERPSEREAAERARQNKVQGQRGTDLLAKAEQPSAPIAGVAPAAPPVRQEPSAAEADRAAPAPSAAAPSRSPQAFGIAESALARARESTGEWSSRDAAVRWRIAGVGIVERSADGGASWERIDTGTRTELRAGSCPSSSVCWVIGRSGVVLLTTDARTWRQVSSPSPEDLVAVDATDARTAVVRGTQGQSFRTVDAGATWARVP